MFQVLSSGDGGEIRRALHGVHAEKEKKDSSMKGERRVSVWNFPPGRREDFREELKRGFSTVLSISMLVSPASVLIVAGCGVRTPERSPSEWRIILTLDAETCCFSFPVLKIIDRQL